jgi:carbon monoxide dehydrogenase subunit G
MVKVSRSVSINAPLQAVWDFVSQPTNLLEVWPSLVDVTNVQNMPNGGHSFEWTYKMAGMRFEGWTQDVEVIPNLRVRSDSLGGIQSTIAWSFTPQDGGTHVTFTAEYTVPIPLLGKLAEAFIVRQNEQEAETILNNLKARLET